MIVELNLIRMSVCESERENILVILKLEMCRNTKNIIQTWHLS